MYAYSLQRRQDDDKCGDLQPHNKYSTWDKVSKLNMVYHQYVTFILFANINVNYYFLQCLDLFHYRTKRQWLGMTMDKKIKILLHARFINLNIYHINLDPGAASKLVGH